MDKVYVITAGCTYQSMRFVSVWSKRERAVEYVNTLAPSAKDNWHNIGTVGSTAYRNDEGKTVLVMISEELLYE